MYLSERFSSTDLIHHESGRAGRLQQFLPLRVVELADHGDREVEDRLVARERRQLRAHT